MSVDTPSTTSGRPTQSVMNLLMANPAAAAALPSPDEAVPRTALDDRIDASQFTKFCEKGILRSAGRAGDAYASRGHLWTVPMHISRWIEHNCQATTTPCGRSTGIRNLGDGWYSCTDDACDCRFRAETAREVLDG